MNLYLLTQLNGLVGAYNMARKLMMNNITDIPVENSKNYLIIKEDFNDDNFNFNITGDWTRYATNEMGGSYVYKSNSISDNGVSSFSFFTEQKQFDKCILYFSYNVSSEGNWDPLRVFVNEIEVRTIFGTGYYSIKIDCSKVNNIRFSYTKDRSGSAGRDNAYIDEIKLMYYNLDSHFVITKTIDTFTESDISVTNTNWIIENGYLKSQTIDGGKKTETQIIINNVSSLNNFMRITYDISSEEGYDKFGIRYHDSKELEMNFLSSDIASNCKYLLAYDSGIKTNQILDIPLIKTDMLLFFYIKDASTNIGEDCVKITKIEFGYLE